MHTTSASLEECCLGRVEKVDGSMLKIRQEWTSTINFHIHAKCPLHQVTNRLQGLFCLSSFLNNMLGFVSEKPENLPRFCAGLESCNVLFHQLDYVNVCVYEMGMETPLMDSTAGTVLQSKLFLWFFLFVALNLVICWMNRSKIRKLLYKYLNKHTNYYQNTSNSLQVIHTGLIQPTFYTHPTKPMQTPLQWHLPGKCQKWSPGGCTSPLQGSSSKTTALMVFLGIQATGHTILTSFCVRHRENQDSDASSEPLLHTSILHGSTKRNHSLHLLENQSNMFNTEYGDFKQAGMKCFKYRKAISRRKKKEKRQVIIVLHHIKRGETEQNRKREKGDKHCLKQAAVSMRRLFFLCVVRWG
ncbi:hypothetical protein VP01_1898g1 [Puccinia sorghi]|uniref:Uncharacterized protein n=1 Tax=Puccinia sorghi TaxID=27349 RepID=A0A0L6VDG4_9BASI|nr:hypothetical protein VP01_1898g1 [Puccinia sorghi]